MSMGVVGLSASSASATDTNQPGTWETLPGETCTKVDDRGAQSGGYTIDDAPTDGYVYSKIILKKGSGDSQGEENTVIYKPVQGQTYFHLSGSGYSHVILCQVPENSEVSPVTPQVTESGCIEGEPTAAKLNLPEDTEEIDYEYGAGETTVVATLKDPDVNDWGTLPTGWSSNGSTATYTPPAGSLDDAKCGEDKTPVSPATPKVTPSRCVEGEPTAAKLNLPEDTDEITYSYGVGETTVVATLKDPDANEWGTLPAGWSPDGSMATYTPPAGSLDDVTCGIVKTDVSPVSPTVTPSRCVGTNPTTAVINKPADGNSIAYELNGATVTATLTDTVNHQWGSMPVGWVQVDADTATYTVPASALAAADCTPPPPPPPPTDVCPNISGLQASVPAGYQLINGDCVEILGIQEIAPTVSFADPTCERLNRAKWSGNLKDLVDYTVSGTPGRGNSVTVTANIKPAVADQFAFADGFVNTFDHSYPSKADLNCPTVKGSESSRPKPQKTPTVLGTQAVAPTAVDAGLASLPGDSATSTASLLAQLMVAGGLLLLLAGGWLGLGRRENGAHQA